MIKILGVKIMKSVQNDVWRSGVVSINPACRWRVDGVVYWLVLAVGDV
jgi:hypothetical protein